MDDFNKNPFDEQKPDQQNPYDVSGQYPPDQDSQSADPYDQSGQPVTPYNQQLHQGDPYNQPAGQNPYNNQQGNPYNQQGNPYNQQQGNPYNQQQGNPYNQQQGNPYSQQQGNPYSQQQGNPYNQPSGQNPYAMPQQKTPYDQPAQNPYAAYGQQAYYQSYPQNQSTGMAIASLVLGILSIVLLIPTLGAPFLIVIPIIGLILGIIYKSKHLPMGKGLSTAGIITSICGIILPIFILIIFVVLLMNHSLDGLMAEYLKQLQQTDPDLYKQYRDILGDTFPEWFTGVLFIFGLK